MNLISKISVVFLIVLSAALLFSSGSFAKWEPWVGEAPPLEKEEIITSVPGIAAVASLRFYQIYLSPLLQQNKCNFTPSCSNYALQSVKKYGAVKGMVMAFDRLSRDNPWAWSGRYPVKDNKLYDPPSANYYWW